MGRTRSQTIDFLGYLRGQLQGLQGIATLCYELIQNADDVRDDAGNPGASRITFDVCDDALWVENDGVFRERDFERMQRLSWGDKSQEANTTGAFGIGFISVYQITDTPELFSSDRHWIFRPEKDQNERILEEEVKTENTRFRLPWAFENSEVRRTLTIPPVPRDALERYVDDIAQAIKLAALFLRQITILEVKRNGVLRRRIEVVKEAKQYLIDDGETNVVWRIFRGNLNDLEDYHNWRLKYRESNSQLENRDPKVEIAVPESPLGKGRLYAFLPSETFTGLPFHINADFFPSPDRKRIPLEGDYRAEWNLLALTCASEVLAKNIDGLLDLFPDLYMFWRFVTQVKEADEKGPLHPKMPVFWERMRLGVVTRRTVLTTRQKKSYPHTIYYPPKNDVAQAAAIFEDLGLPILHPSLREFQNLLTSKEIGVKILKMQDVLEAMENAHLFHEPHALTDFPPSLQSRDNWLRLWEALQSLGVEEAAENRLQHLSIVFGEDGRLYPPAMLLAEPKKDVRDLFSAIASEVMWLSSQIKSSSFPGVLVPQLDFIRGLELLEKHEGNLASVLQNPKYLKTLYTWLAEHEEDLKRAVERVRALPIGPTVAGQFKPLEQLFLTGDFEDPLQLAEVLDLSAIPEYQYFVEKVLGVSVLNLETYIREHVPRAWPEISREKQEALVRLLSQKLIQLKNTSGLQAVLQKLPLVLCDDEQFRTANNVYLSPQPARMLMGEHIAVVKQSLAGDKAIRDFYKWLGVEEEVRPDDLLMFVREIAQSAPTEERIEKISKVFEYLATKWSSFSEDIKEKFTPLKRFAWLPGSKDSSRWFRPTEVYADFQKHLFESQGNFLQIKNPIQKLAKDLIPFLGVKTSPEDELVVRHLAFCAKNKRPVNPAVYKFLNDAVSRVDISHLKNTACLYIELESEAVAAQYYHPSEVFLGEHPFGTYRLQLPKKFYDYRDFLEAIGVKEKPDYQDAIGVLQDIGRSKIAQSHIPLNQGSDEEKVLFAAWKMLNEALLNGQVEERDIFEQLHGHKCIPNTQGILYEPEKLFFEDRPGWAKKFDLMTENIAPRIKGLWQAMSAAGVSRLSSVVETSIAELEALHRDTKIAARLDERSLLLHRALDTAGQSEKYSNILSGITFIQASKIVVIRTLKAFGREESKTEVTDAIYLPDEKKLYYVSLDNHAHWACIAREISYAIDAKVVVDEERLLLFALEKILSGASFEAVAREFDALGLPPLEDLSAEKARPAKARSWGESLTEEPETETGKFSDHPSTTSQPLYSQRLPSPNTPSTISSPVNRHSSKRTTSRTTQRLISYVLPQNAIREDRASYKRKQEIGQMGVDLVMEFERQQGRQPKDMNVEHPNHPGYDIMSFSPKTGETRCIEVKALTQPWDGRNPARMTPTEFETAKKRGNDYWLYIVENVDSDSPRLYCIQNPAKRVQYFCYDHGWREVSLHAEGYPLKWQAGATLSEQPEQKQALQAKGKSQTTPPESPG